MSEEGSVEVELEEIPDDDPDYDVEDDAGLTTDDLTSLVLYTLDWSVQSLLERIGSSFDIDPTFQRRDAWNVERKSRYIESLMLTLPVPQIVLAEDPAKKGRFIVLDGKQRLLTIKQFAAPDANFKLFKLKKLEFATQLDGMSFDEITSSVYSDFAENFLSQPIRTIVVRDWRKPAVLYQIFVRLNQGSLALSPQELRQALYPSAFTRWINARSSVSRPIQIARRIKREDFRMRDAEMLLRYVAFQANFESYGGNLREFLDEACEWGERTWGSEGEGYFEAIATQCELAIDRAILAFGERDSFLRWDVDKYIRRFNIAVFDVMTAVLGDPSITDLEFNNHRDEMVSRFQQLCVSDSHFRESLVTTTKTKNATSYRVLAYGREIENVLGHPLEIIPRAEILSTRA